MQAFQRSQKANSHAMSSLPESELPVQLADLPEDELLLIAARLDPPDLLNLSSTCKRITDVLQTVRPAQNRVNRPGALPAFSARSLPPALQDAAWERQVSRWLAQQHSSCKMEGVTPTQVQHALGLGQQRATCQALCPRRVAGGRVVDGRWGHRRRGRHTVPRSEGRQRVQIVCAPAWNRDHAALAPASGADNSTFPCTAQGFAPCERMFEHQYTRVIRRSSR